MIKRMVRYFTGPDLDPHCLKLFDIFLQTVQVEIDQTERYTLTVINLFDLVTATSVLPEEYFLEYSSD